MSRQQIRPAKWPGIHPYSGRIETDQRSVFGLINFMIFIYIWMWILEGALRKWVFPQWSAYLLLIRDPILLYTYYLAFRRRVLDFDWIIRFCLFFGIVFIICAYFSAETNFLITLYGIHVYLLHLPLISVIGRTFSRDDLQKIKRQLIWCSFPMAVLAVAQFSASSDSWLNAVAGGEGRQIMGAADKVRVPGPFSYNTGLGYYVVLLLVFAIEMLIVDARRLRLGIASTMAGLLILSVSISRSTILQSGAVVLAILGGAIVRGRRAGRALFALGAMGIAFLGISYVGVFREGSAAFQERWQSSTADSGQTVNTAIVARLYDSYTEFMNFVKTAEPFGLGVGLGSNVGGVLKTGKIDFYLVEDPWSNIVLECGPLVGGCYIIFRCVLACYIGLVAWRASKTGELCAIPLFVACVYSLTVGNWGPPVNLGGTVITAGLALATAKVAMGDRVPVGIVGAVRRGAWAR